MSDFYTNIAVNRNEILVCGYLDGKRYRQVVDYHPYFFLPSARGTYRTLEGQSVERKEFNSIKAARDYFDRHKDIPNFRIYGYDKFAYTYINDAFLGDIQYDVSKLIIHILDIEVDSTGGFADINLADKPITLIGIRQKNIRLVLGWKENYTPKDPSVVYIYCKDENDMLRKFINIWSDDDARPDIVTGWNIEKYDIPMLVNRIKRLFGDDEAKRLSPWGILRQKTIESRGKQYQVYVPLGVNILDYYDLYRKFTYSQLESYSLDHVAWVEVKRRKLDYSEYGSLQNLFEQNYEKFVDYNIGDLDRVFEIDEKNRFIELALAIAYDAKVNYIDSLTSVLLWETIIHNHLLGKGIVFPHHMKSSFMEIPGAFVKEPVPGMYEWVVSFDLQSLYPHLIMGTNISPETFVDIQPWNDSDLERVVQRGFKETSEFARAGNGARFRRDKQGFFGELMKIQFSKRKEYKDRMLALKKTNPEKKNEIAALHNLQLAKKIQLNSCYGAIANEYFAFYDWRLSSAITLSGQLAIRWIEKRLNEYLNETLKTQGVDYIIAIDTDSVYIDCRAFVEKFCSDKTSVYMGGEVERTKKRVDFLDKVGQQFLQKFIDKSYAELAEILNSYENTMIMKRDIIADKAIWRAKKAYVMNVWDAEGVRYEDPDLKIMGIEVVKAVIPQVCRDAMKSCLRLVMAGDQQGVKRFIKEFRTQFDAFQVEDISFPRGVNGLAKYADAKDIWKKATPVHVKGALLYNHLIRQLKLKDCEPIFDREKIKFVYLREPNPYLASVISFPKSVPREFEIGRFVDRQLMFEKTFLDPIKSLLGVIGWDHEEKSTLEAFFA